MAEALLRKLLGSRTDIRVSSAGIDAFEGRPASPQAIQVLAKEGIDLSSHRSRFLTASMVEEASLIFTMTRDHREILRILFPEAESKTFLVREFYDGELNVPDPIGGSLDTYENCKNVLQKSVQAILQKLDSDPSMIPKRIPRHLAQADPAVFTAIEREALRQAEHIELIASENYAPQAVLEAQGSCLTNKYAEGYPGRRWYGGCEHVDEIEALAIERAKRLFGAEHANVQPHSGSQANMAVYFSVLSPGDKILTMNLAHGGHLTHGHKANFSGKIYNVVHYGVDQNTELINYDELAEIAQRERPKMITAGASAYPREIDFARMRQIADSVGAYLFVDMAHIAGLVAGGVHPNPVPYAHFVTTTTHKSLRGPRGGLILCREEFAKKIDAMVFPCVQGGPLMHVIAAKAVCLGLALQPEFAQYARQVVSNAKALAARLSNLGYRLVSGGTDNHLMLVDLRPAGLDGLTAQVVLDKAAITVNKNAIPFDTEPISKTGGIRLGTPAMTTRGMREDEMMEIAELIHAALQARSNEAKLQEIRAKVIELTARFPIP